MTSTTKRVVSIANPRDAATLSAYFGYLIFGLFVGPFGFASISVKDILPAWSENVWAYSFLLGGILYILGAFFYKRLEIALTLQSAGSLGAFFGLLTYGLAVFARSGYPNGVPLFLLAFGLSVASLVRGITCYREIGRLQRAVTKPTQTMQVLAEGGSEGEES